MNNCQPVQPRVITAEASTAASSGRLDTLVSGARERAMDRLFKERVEAQREMELCRQASRRDFVATAGLGVVAVGAFSLLGQRVASADGSARRTTPSAAGVAAGFAWDNLLFQAGHVALLSLCQAHNVPLASAASLPGRASREELESIVEQLKERPDICTKAYIHAGLFVPIREEVVFRVLPSGFLRGGGSRWEAGIPLSIAFAAMHNLVPSSEHTEKSLPIGDRTKLSLDYVPLPQLLFGAFCWYLARSYGELAPVLAHVAHNQYPALCLVWGGRQTLAQFERLFQEELARCPDSV